MVPFYGVPPAAAHPLHSIRSMHSHARAPSAVDARRMTRISASHIASPNAVEIACSRPLERMTTPSSFELALALPRSPILLAWIRSYSLRFGIILLDENG